VAGSSFIYNCSICYQRALGWFVAGKHQSYRGLHIFSGTPIADINGPDVDEVTIILGISSSKLAAERQLIQIAKRHYLFLQVLYLIIW
jgi:hypothetical protein